MLPIDAQIFRSLFEWVGNSATADDIQNLKSTLSRLSPEQKFQVLSTSLQALPRSYQLQLSLEAYLLHEIIYRICDPRLDPVEGRDPGLIGCFLSGLSDDQKISLFTKVDYNRNTPLQCPPHVIEDNTAVFEEVFRELLKDMPPDKKYELIMKSSVFGFVRSAILSDSVDLIREIRKGLDSTQWGAILRKCPYKVKDHPLACVQSPEMVGALLGRMTEADCAEILSVDNEGDLLAQILRKCDPGVISAFLNKIDDNQIFSLIRGAQENEGVLTDMVNGNEESAARLAALLSGLSDTTVEEIYNLLTESFDPSIVGRPPIVSHPSIKELLADAWEKAAREMARIASLRAVFRDGASRGEEGVSTGMSVGDEPKPR